MNFQKRKRSPGDTRMSSREIERSIRRIEDELYFGSDNIKIRLTRIEDKLDIVVPSQDLGHSEFDIDEIISDLKSHLNNQFRWTVVTFLSCSVIFLTVMKLT